MRFSFVDRVLGFEPGVSITAVKCLSLAEEYLADHFPRFPVMPGVLMLEAMTEAGAWLVRVSENFAHSIVTLQEARNIRFTDFVRPGRVLTVRAEIARWETGHVQLKTQGTVDGQVAVSGRLVLSAANLADTRPGMAATDVALKRLLAQHWRQILQPSEPIVVAGGSALVAPLNVTPQPTQGKV